MVHHLEWRRGTRKRPPAPVHPPCGQSQFWLVLISPGSEVRACISPRSSRWISRIKPNRNRERVQAREAMAHGMHVVQHLIDIGALIGVKKSWPLLPTGSEESFACPQSGSRGQPLCERT